MAINVRTDDATGEVKAWGQDAFADSAPDGQTDANLASADKTDEADLNTYGPAHCTVAGGRIVADALASAKAAKVKAVREHTAALVDLGAVYEGETYMATDKGRFDVLGTHTMGVIGGDSSAFPATFTAVDGRSSLTCDDAEAFGPFFLEMTRTYRHWQSTSEVLVQEINDAETVGEVDAVTDDRVWPAPVPPTYDPSAVAGLVAWWEPVIGDITLNGPDVSAHNDNELSHNLSASGVEQPVYNANPMNGHPTVSYASGETMTTPDADDLDMGQNSFLVVMVMKRPRYAGSYAVQWGKGDKPSANGPRGFITSGDRLQLFWGSDVQGYTAGSTDVPDDVPCMLAWGIDAVSEEVIYVIDGAVERISVTLSGTGSNALPFRIHGDGDSSLYDNDTSDNAMTLVFKRDAVTAWTDAEIQGIFNNYAQSKWAI